MSSRSPANEVGGPARSRAIEMAGFSDQGPVRKENQDAWQAIELTGGRSALLLADGMGGHAGGSEAANAAVTAAARIVEASTEAAPAALTAAVGAANDAVGEVAAQLGGDPGTTLVLAFIEGDEATVANVGDSRAYLVRAGTARPITQDHSWVGEQVQKGLIAPGDLRKHPRRNMITRAVMGEALTPDLFSVQLRPHDVLLLCSDGLWEPVEDEQLADLLTDDLPLSVLVERAGRAALDAGGTDNVTVVAARRL